MNFITQGLYFFGLFTMIFPTKYSNQLNFIILTIIISFQIVASIVKLSLPKLIFNRLNVLMIIWLVYSLYSINWVIDVNYWEYNNTYLVIATGYTLVLSYMLSDNKIINRTLLVIVFFLTVHVLIGYFETITGIYLFTSNYNDLSWYKMAGYPVSFFFNTNDYATFLLFGIIALLSIDIENTFTKNHLLLYSFRNGMVVSCIFLIFMTDSRLITLLSILTIIFYSLIKKNFFIQRTISTIVFIIGLTMILTILFTQSDLIQKLILNDASGETRFVLIKDSISILQATSFRGVGAGNLSPVYQMFRGGYNSSTISIHNWWVEVLVTYGLLFFLIYISFYLRKTYASMEILFYKKSENFYFIWILLFIPAALASSTLFDKTWIWVINSFVMISLIKTQKELKPNK